MSLLRKSSNETPLAQSVPVPIYVPLACDIVFELLLSGKLQNGNNRNHRKRKENCLDRTLVIRQYIPKHTNFDNLTDKKIASIQKKINNRPRQKLKFETPKAEFYKRIV